MSKILGNSVKRLPKASTVLTNYLEQSNEPPWTSFFVKYGSVIDDQRGRSHFNWKAGHSNYHVLRSGCFPYIKYHCTKRPYENLELEDKLFYVLKLVNLGEQSLKSKNWIVIASLLSQRKTTFKLMRFFFQVFRYYCTAYLPFL